MTGQLFGFKNKNESQKACPLRQKSVRFSLNLSKEATDFCLRQRHGGCFYEGNSTTDADREGEAPSGVLGRTNFSTIPFQK